MTEKNIKASREKRHQVILAALLLLSLLLVAGKKLDKDFLSPLSEGLMAEAVRGVEWLSFPWRGIVRLGERIDKWNNLDQRYQKALAELEQLREVEVYNQQLEYENRYLRSELNYAGGQIKKDKSFVTARVAIDNAGLFSRSLLIDVGHEKGVAKGDIALSRGHLVGRVAQLDYNVGRILLLTDFNSRVPVLVGPEGIRALMVGDNSDKPRLTFLPAQAKIEGGMAVITSGHGGVFPSGIRVGIVEEKEKGGEMKIIPHADFSRLYFVDLLGRGVENIAGNSEK